MSDTGSTGSPTPAPDGPPPGNTRIQQVQGKGRWRVWVLALVLVIGLVAVGLLLWVADRQTANDEAASKEAAEETTAVATTEPGTTTLAPTTEATTTTSAAATTIPPTTVAPTTSPATTAEGATTTLAPTTTVPPFEGVLAVVADQPEFSTLSSLLATAGIYSVPEPATVFAPTNAAFDALPAATVAYLTDPDNVDVLTQVLTNHVVRGSYPVADLPTGTTLTSLDGQELEITTEGDRILVSGVPVVGADLDGGDGSVIHAIDGVLVPANVDLPS